MTVLERGTSSSGGRWGGQWRPPLQTPRPLCGCLCLETQILTLLCGTCQGLKEYCGASQLCSCQIRGGVPGDMWLWELKGSRRHLETLSSDPEAQVFQNKNYWVKRTHVILSNPLGRCQLSAYSVPFICIVLSAHCVPACASEPAVLG